MIDSGDEPHLGDENMLSLYNFVANNLRSGHGIVLRQKQLQFENAALKRRSFWSSNHDVEVSGVVVVRNRRDAGNWFLHQSLSFLDDSSW